MDADLANSRCDQLLLALPLSQARHSGHIEVEVRDARIVARKGVDKN
jgi:hypothetical protein